MDLGPLWNIGAALVAAGAVYGAIRADLKGIHTTIRDAKERADRIEERLNRHIEQGVTHGT